MSSNWHKLYRYDLISDVAVSVAATTQYIYRYSCVIEKQMLSNNTNNKGIFSISQSLALFCLWHHAHMHRSMVVGSDCKMLHNFTLRARAC